MMNYSSNKVDILLTLGERNKNYRHDSRYYAELYPIIAIQVFGKW